MAVEVGAAYVSITPNMQGFATNIQQAATAAINQVATELESRIEQAGERAGQGVGSGVEQGAKSAKTSIADLAVSIAAVATIAGGIGQAMQRGLQAAKLQASFGMTPAEAKSAAETAGKVYANAWGDSLDEVNASVGTVMQNLKGMNLGGSASIEGLTTKALAFKGAFGVEVPDSIRAVSQMIRTGLVPDATTAFDVLAVGFQNGSDKAGDLVDTFNEYGTQFRKLGLDGPRAMGLISQAIQAGARDSDLAADALKEFSIRAVDGSKLSADSFKALGLNAQTMTEQIAQGGPKASAGLQLVLDRLKGIKDPATQAQIATGLFGTQAEDLGAALFAMNPATASAQNGIQNVAGASDRVTAAMNNATPPLEAFKRQGMEAVGNAASFALPFLTGVVSAITPYAGVIGSAVLALGGFVLVMKGVEAVQGAVATIKAFELATKATTIATYASSIATGIATAAQWAWNAAFIASPIGWIVLAIGLLVGAVIYAWTHFEGFRKVVIACWEGIQTAAQWAWQNVLQPTFNGIRVAIMDYLVPAALWLWRNVFEPVWAGISAAASFAWNNIIKPVFAAFQAYINILATVATWLWRNIIEPAWTGIRLAISIAWALIQVVFGLITIGVKLLAATFSWLWDNVIKPVWSGISASISFYWNNVVLPVFNAIKFTISNVLAPIFQWLYNNVIKPVWDGISATISWVWNNGIKPIFNALGGFIRDYVVPAFRTGVAAIGAAWDGLKEAAKAPIRFVVNTVINQGIIDNYNKLARMFHVGEVGHVNLPAGFHTGGIYPGYTPGRDVGYIGVSGGEAIMRPEWTRAVGPEYVHGANKAAISGGVAGVQNYLGGFAGGGIVEWLTDPIAAAKSAFSGPMARLSEITNSDFGRMVAGLPKTVVQWVTDKIKDVVSHFGFGGGGGGGSFGAWPSSPAAQRGDSGVWRAVVALIRSTGPLSGSFGNAYRPGDPLWHGSGRAVDWMGFNQDALATFLASRNPLELIHRTAQRDYAYTRGRNMGSFNNGLMEEHRNHVHIAMDQGGWLGQGTQLVTHRPRLPDAVLTNDQWRDMRRAASYAEEHANGSAGSTINVYPQRADFTTQDLEALQARQDALARVGRPR